MANWLKHLEQVPRGLCCGALAPLVDTRNVLLTPGSFFRILVML
jgi:hypothetical protein